MPIRTIDPALYRKYRDRVIELGNHVTVVRDGEYVAELRSSAEIAAEIDELTEEQVAEIRNIAINELTPMAWYQTGDDELG